MKITLYTESSQVPAGSPPFPPMLKQGVMAVQKEASDEFCVYVAATTGYYSREDIATAFVSIGAQIYIQHHAAIGAQITAVEAVTKKEHTEAIKKLAEQLVELFFARTNSPALQ